MRLILFAALALAACGPTVTTQPVSPTPPVSQREQAIVSIAETAATIADAATIAPPGTLTTVTIDDVAIRRAFRVADASFSVLDALVDTGVVTRNSLTARQLRRGVLATKDALNAASAAQRAGSATTYREALEKAQLALADIRSALSR